MALLPAWPTPLSPSASGGAGEHDFGGFPSYLVTIPGLVLRTNDTAYLDRVDAWWATLMPVLTPRLYANGGAVAALQIENEFVSGGHTPSSSIMMVVRGCGRAVGGLHALPAADADEPPVTAHLSGDHHSHRPVSGGDDHHSLCRAPTATLAATPPTTTTCCS